MPVVLQGAPTVQALSWQAVRGKYKYDYPGGLDLRPGSKLHTLIRDQIWQRARDSYFEISKRHTSWNKIARSLGAYITPTVQKAMRKKAKIKEPSEDITLSQWPVIVPVSYATLETLLTYFTAAFLESPIFKYEGMGPEDTLGAILLEKVIEVHSRKSTMGLNLHTMWRDSFSYGFGAIAPSWTKQTGMRVVSEPEGFVSRIRDMFVSTGIKRSQAEYTIFEGNELLNIDPYKYLPDPNVPIHEVQKGEFVGWIDRTNRMAILADERTDKDAFNAQYVKHLTTGRSSIIDVSTDARNRGLSTSIVMPSTHPVDVIYMYVNLIPREWTLARGEYPEKWMFALAGDEIIIGAKRLGLAHNLFPVAVAAPDYDGYSIVPTSRLEITYGLQDTINWLFSSHVANVRKAINDRLVVDPSLININDLATPRPGGIIRTRRAAWGRGVKDAVEQLKITDITQNHIKDTAFIMDLIEKSTAASEGLQGIVKKTGPRTSALEARDSRTSALSRLEKAAKIVGMQAMQPLAYMMASHTQQLMTDELFVKTTGRWEQELKEEFGIEGSRRAVRPSELIVEYDVLPYDGSMPGGEPADLWINLYQILATNPEIAQEFDVVRIFKHIARQLGAKNVNDFVRRGGGAKFEMKPNGEVEREVERGNLVPLGK